MTSPDNPAYYLTSVARDRLPVFKTDRVKSIACQAIDEARRSGGFLIFAHQNPVRLDLVDRAEIYQWSSARQWQGLAARDEPLLVNIKDIQWRRR
jgi:hypothetical protein